MFIPLYDKNNLKHIKLQWMTLIIIAINIAIWLVITVNGDESDFAIATVWGLGFIPSVANDISFLPEDLALIPEQLSYISYAFIHAGFLHLAGNMIFLWVFADNVEDALGHVRFLIFYLLCAAAGAFFHALLIPNSDAPLIGASGAAAGVVAAYLLLHPKTRIWILVFSRIPVPLPSYIALSLWIAFQFYMLFVDPDGSVSWGAHVGGILAGGLLILFMRRKGVPLFDGKLTAPTANKKTSFRDKSEPKSSPKWGRDT